MSLKPEILHGSSYWPSKKIMMLMMMTTMTTTITSTSTFFFQLNFFELLSLIVNSFGIGGVCYSLELATVSLACFICFPEILYLTEKCNNSWMHLLFAHFICSPAIPYLTENCNNSWMHLLLAHFIYPVVCISYLCISYVAQ